MAKINGTDIEIITDDSEDIGTFDIAYSFELINSKNEIDISQAIIDWLAQNCTDNFIVILKTRKTIAGGYGDNFSAWKKNLFKASPTAKRNNIVAPYYTYQIRLSHYDCVAFTMRWVTND